MQIVRSRGSRATFVPDMRAAGGAGKEKLLGFGDTAAVTYRHSP